MHFFPQLRPCGVRGRDSQIFDEEREREQKWDIYRLPKSEFRTRRKTAKERGNFSKNRLERRKFHCLAERHRASHLPLRVPSRRRRRNLIKRLLFKHLGPPSVRPSVPIICKLQTHCCGALLISGMSRSFLNKSCAEEETRQTERRRSRWVGVGCFKRAANCLSILLLNQNALA